MLFKESKDEIISKNLIEVEKLLRESELSEISKDKEVEFYL